MHPDRTLIASVIIALVILVAAPLHAEGADDFSKAMELEQKANKYAKAGNLGKALSLYMDSLALNPKNGNALYNASNVAAALKDNKRSMLLLTSFIAVEPQGPDTPAMQAKLDKLKKSMAKYSGTIEVTLEPEGAMVTVDGLFVGNAPIEGLVLPADKYDLKASFLDYHDLKESVSISAGEETMVAKKLKKITFYGTFTVKTVPEEGVQVFADGTLVATTPMAEPIKLEAERKVFIELKKPGFDKWIRNVTLIRDELYTLHATLEAIPAGGPPATP